MESSRRHHYTVPDQVLHEAYSLIFCMCHVSHIELLKRQRGEGKMGDEFCLQIIISLAIRLGLEGWIWGAKSRPLKKFRLRSRPQKSFFRLVYSGTIHRCIHATSFRISERQLKWSGIRTSKMSWPASGNWNLPFWHPNWKVVLPMVFSIRVDTFKVSPSPNISLSLFMILGWFSYNKNLLQFGSDAWEFVMTDEIC